MPRETAVSGLTGGGQGGTVRTALFQRSAYGEPAYLTDADTASRVDLGEPKRAEMRRQSHPALSREGIRFE